MTSTVTDRFPHNGGDVHTILLDITSYPTGGESITNSILGLPFDADPLVIGVVGREDNVFGRHDTTNNKLILFDEGGEIANATDVGVVAITVRQPAK